MEYTESDLLVRLIEPLYDVAWAYQMSSAVDHVAKRMERRRKTFSSTASVVSTATSFTMSTTDASDSVSGTLSVSDKVAAMENLLHRVSRVMRARQFEDVCRVSLKSSDDLYPGFRDVLFISQYLMGSAEPYRGVLTRDEINGLTLTQVFQYIFYEFCAFLLSGNRLGKEAIKLIITPTKITHAAYELCRQKFARLLCEETGFVQEGLLRLITKIKKDREPALVDVDVEMVGKKEEEECVEISESSPPKDKTTAKTNEEADTTDAGDDNADNAVVVLPETEEGGGETGAPQTPPCTRNVKTPPRPVKSMTSLSRAIFPVIELSSSDDDDGESSSCSSSSDESSVSSLEM